jgi:archaellum component FlaC
VINNSITTLTAQELSHYISTQTNLSTIMSTLGVINGKTDSIILNVSSVYTDTQYIRANMLTSDNVTGINNKLDAISANITELQAYCNGTATSTSQLCKWVNNINAMVTDINSTSGQYTTVLNQINSTTTSTYNYVTGTLASNINTLLGTTDRIETNTIQINGTVNTISTNVNTINNKVDVITNNLTTVINNQEDEVYIEVSS